MRRREFLKFVTGVTVPDLWPLTTLAQHASKSYRIGYLALLTGERATLAKVFCWTPDAFYSNPFAFRTVLAAGE